MSKTYVYVRLALLGLLAGYVVHLGIQNYSDVGKLNACAQQLQETIGDRGQVLECKRVTFKAVDNIYCTVQNNFDQVSVVGHPTTDGTCD